ncbi:MAG: adenylate/guanylate cyclase domain-containing protein, partial [Desulfobacterales bacterium]
MALLGILPFLIVVYLFHYEKFDVTDTVVTFSALALFSILTGVILLRKSSVQLIDLSRKTDIAKDGESNGPITIIADQELSDIAENFNIILNKLNSVDRNMKEQSIQLMSYARDLAQSYKRTIKEEELRSRLSRYVGEHLVEKLINSKKGVFFENEKREVTILFADIRSFTTIAERMAAENVIAMLNQFFDIVVDIVFRNNGILDKFVGDQLMAVFGIISPNSSAPYDAVKTAIETQDASENLMNLRRKQDKETFEIGIGINTGSAIVGNVGSENRMDYTVIGDSVNVAGRLQQMAKGGEIVIGEQTYAQIKDRFHIEKKLKIKVKNKTEPV